MDDSAGPRREPAGDRRHRWLPRHVRIRSEWCESGDKDRLYLASALGGLSDHAAATGDRRKAVDYLEQALAITDEFAQPRPATLRTRLAELTD